MQDGKKLGARINDQPQPQDLLRTPQPRAQFVQLEMWEVQGAEAALMEELCVRALASEPDGDGGLTVAEDSFSGRWVQPLGQRREYPCDLMGRGFQTIQGGVAPGAECGLTGLATNGRHLLSATMCAIPNQIVDGSVCIAEVWALLIGTGEAFGEYALGCSLAAFHLTPGAYWRWSRFHIRREDAGEETGWAVKRGSWPEETWGCGVDGPSS